MLQQKKEESARQSPLVLPVETEAAPPFHQDDYEELHPKHKEQSVFTYIPFIRSNFNGEKEDFDRLSQEQRFQLYEKAMLGHVSNMWEEIEKIKSRKKAHNKIKRSSSKKISEVMEMVESNPNLRAEDLVHILPKKVFSKLMLYVKYAGNNRDSIRRFFENMEK